MNNHIFSIIIYYTLFKIYIYIYKKEKQMKKQRNRAKKGIAKHTHTQNKDIIYDLNLLH